MLDLTAERILAIPAHAPERLFSGDGEAVTVRFRELVKLWPPTRNRDVFQRIVELKDAANARLKAGGGAPLDEVHLESESGKTYRIRYLRRHAFELGEMLVCRTKVVFVLKSHAEDLARNGYDRVQALRFDSIPNRDHTERQMPKMTFGFGQADGSEVWVLDKTPDLVLLRDLLDHHGGALNWRHVAWIASTLHDMACYLSHVGIAHNAIGPDTLFVSPEHHGGVLLGGWFYAAPIGERMRAAPGRTVSVVAPSILREKKGDPRADAELIRATVAESLGASGSAGIPPAFMDWLRSPVSGNAVENYESWERARDRLGPRRFAAMETTPSDVYGPIAIG